MPRFAFLLFLVAIAGRTFAADPAKQDVQKFQGAWKPLSVEVGGESLDKDMIKDWLLVVAGDKMQVMDGETEKDASVFQLDPSKKPAAIRITYTSGKARGTTLSGIYTFDGDTLKICVGPQDEPPAEFKTKADTDQFLVILKRKKDGR